MKAQLHEFSHASASVWWPWLPQQRMRSVRKVSEPSHSNVLSIVTVPESSAAASVMILKIEPGSNVSVTERLRDMAMSVVTSLRSGLFRSNVGFVAVARISPVDGSMTMPVTVFALLTDIHSASAVSRYPCAAVSAVSVTSYPLMGAMYSSSP